MARRGGDGGERGRGPGEGRTGSAGDDSERQHVLSGRRGNKGGLKERQQRWRWAALEGLVQHCQCSRREVVRRRSVASHAGVEASGYLWMGI